MYHKHITTDWVPERPKTRKAVDQKGLTKKAANLKGRKFYAVYDYMNMRLMLDSLMINKRAQRALGRSPEEKVKGHSGANNREHQGHNLNKFGRGPFHDVIY